MKISTTRLEKRTKIRAIPHENKVATNKNQVYLTNKKIHEWALKEYICFLKRVFYLFRRCTCSPKQYPHRKTTETCNSQ